MKKRLVLHVLLVGQMVGVVCTMRAEDDVVERSAHQECDSIALLASGSAWACAAFALLSNSVGAGVAAGACALGQCVYGAHLGDEADALQDQVDKGWDDSEEN